MKQIRIGILGAADIAERRFLPALRKTDAFCFAGIAVSKETRLQKAERMINEYGGKLCVGYENLIRDDKIDAVYIPQLPALHYQWAKLALSCGKHVLLEKPGTIRLNDMEELIQMSREKGAALAENYAFCYHKQIKKIHSLLENGEVGELRQVRTAFGFPHRGGDDFRYRATLGGGALFDCGGYTLKAAQLFLGKGVEICASHLNYKPECEVDLFGSIMLKNEEGLTMQAAFGMDNYYKCELEIWGSEGYLLAPRFYTPPADLETEILIRTKVKETTVRVEADDQFLHMIEHFAECILDKKTAEEERQAMLHQMKLVDEVRTNNL